MQGLHKLIVRVGGRFFAVLVFAAAALISACQVEVVETRPVPVQPPFAGGGFCTREFAPVCARRGDRLQTFSNSCLARESGFRIVAPGECRIGRPPVVDYACPRDFNPVCARRGGDVRTFANSCRAEEAGFRVMYGGECNGGGIGGPIGSGPGVGGPQQFCTREYAPVCGRRGSRLSTFPNRCEAENAGYGVISGGPC
jgi:hypothetical protein